MTRAASVAAGLAGAVLAGALVACGGGGGDDGPAADGASTGCAAGERRSLDGFTEVAFVVVTPAGGEQGPDRCALLADDEEERAQGLMGQEDLRGYDGMLFRFEDDSTAAFHMRDTPLPLTVAFFDERGALVSSADMAPCPDRVANCPTYPPAAPYRLALEVPQGGLADLGLGPGARLEVAVAVGPG